MILEHSKDPVSAKWNGTQWDIGERIKYRWVDKDRTARSEWFYDIDEALTWIKEYDISVSSRIG
jgi:hypothetical protein